MKLKINNLHYEVTEYEQIIDRMNAAIRKKRKLNCKNTWFNIHTYIQTSLNVTNLQLLRWKHTKWVVNNKYSFPFNWTTFAFSKYLIKLTINLVFEGRSLNLTHTTVSIHVKWPNKFILVTWPFDILFFIYLFMLFPHWQFNFIFILHCLWVAVL